MVSCQGGHLTTSMLLSSFGASRPTTAFGGCLPRFASTWPDELAKRSGNTELVQWLRESANFTTPLQHIEVLTPARAVALLRSGSSPVAGSPSAAERARKFPTDETAGLILRASAPWSPQTHRLWGARHRAFAVELLKIGYLMNETHGPLLDTWIAHVMPHAIAWEMEDPDSVVQKPRRRRRVQVVDGPLGWR
jgi:hypothetical protein